MALHNIEYNLQSDNRTGIRIEVAKLFTLEESGIGKGENCSKYHYIVEHYGEYSIVLKRPTGLNKGFDFTDGDGILRPIAIILLAIKWLFIEQDITYWNWSGRNMLYNQLIEMGLV